MGEREYDLLTDEPIKIASVRLGSMSDPKYKDDYWWESSNEIRNTRFTLDDVLNILQWGCNDCYVANY